MLFFVLEQMNKHLNMSTSHVTFYLSNIAMF